MVLSSGRCPLDCTSLLASLLLLAAFGHTRAASVIPGYRAVQGQPLWLLSPTQAILGSLGLKNPSGYKCVEGQHTTIQRVGVCVHGVCHGVQKSCRWASGVTHLDPSVLHERSTGTSSSRPMGEMVPGNSTCRAVHLGVPVLSEHKTALERQVRHSSDHRKTRPLGGRGAFLNIYQRRGWIWPLGGVVDVHPMAGHRCRWSRSAPQ